MGYSTSQPGRKKGQLRKRTWNYSDTLVQDSIADISAGWIDSVTKGENPSWRSDIAIGNDATTVLSGERYVTSVYSPGRLETERPSGGTTKRSLWEGMLLANHKDLPGPVAGLAVTDSENMAKSRFLRDLINAQTQMQGLVTLGEIGRTLRMLRRPALALRGGLGDYFKSVKKRTRRAPRRSWGAIAGASWLEYSFGWDQLHRDVKDANSVLEQIGAEQYPRIALKAGGRSEALVGKSFPSTAEGLIAVKGVYTAVDTVDTVFRGAIRSVPESPITMAGRLLGFKFQEFLPTVWELIPYSFLVDYFTNIGDVIQGWSYQRSGLAWSNRTYRKSKTLKLVVFPDYPVIQGSPGLKVTDFSPSVSVTTRTQVTRQSYFGAFTPQVRFELPTGRKIRKLLNVSGLLAIKSL